MSFYDDASLVFLPSGGAGKDTKSYSIKPTNGDGDFTFSRGSNLTATRVDSNGLIEKGRENLLLQSNQFDTTWTTSGSPSLSNGQSGYDGSSDAWLYTNNGSEYIYQDETTNVATYSVFAKKGNGGVGDFLLLFTDGVGGRYFDLDNGVLGSEVLTGLIDSKIELVSGNTDWYRCSITFASSTRVRIYASLADGDFSSVASIYIQDAQLEQGLVATEYIESGATTGLAGILEDSPRFDYSGGASCPSLLLEPSRTNLVTQSEYIDTWNDYTNGNGSAPTITTNYAVSPEGIENATRLQLETNGSASSDASGILESIALDGSSTYTFSFWIKSNSGSSAELSTFVNSSFGVQFTATTEWQRLDFEVVSNSTNPRNFGIVARGNYQQSVDISFWGAQLEEGSYPTSYIPNHSGGSVTREADFATKTGLTSSINSTEGTIFLDFKALANTLPSEYSYFSMSDGTYNNRIAILQSIGATNEVRVFAFVGGTKVFDLSDSVTDITTQTKVALRYVRNAFDLFINGAKVSTDTSGIIFPANTLDRVSFSEIGTTSKTFKGKVNQTLVFQTTLSDAECITLTS